VDGEAFAAPRKKAKTQPWARAALRRLLWAAETALSRPLGIPERGGQWSQWYSCRKDGVLLRTVSPTEHRCPRCGEVYRGGPYDAVVIGREHDAWSRAARDLSLAYRFTGRAEFARRAKEILTAYAGRYAKYPRHNTRGEDRIGGGRITAQTLNESVWLIPMAWSYSLVRETIPSLVRLRIEGDLLLPAVEVIREHKLGIDNIQCWKNSAVGLAGLATGRNDLVTEAIDDPVRGFRVQIAQGVTEEGFWYEGSLGYHVYTLEALWPLAEAARHAGIDLYNDRYSRMYDAPIALASPGGESPGFNDSAGPGLRELGFLYEITYARWRRPAHGHVAAATNRESWQALLYGVEQIPPGPLIPPESALLESAGVALLRAAGPTAVAVRFGRHGGGHGHPDKLGIVTHGAGRAFGLDPGSIQYGTPLHREWYRSTIAHKTVTVDSQLQAAVDGTLERWHNEGGVTSLVAAAGQVYPGVRLRRTLVVRAGEVADRFECASERQHTYDWAFHAPGELATSLELPERRQTLGAANGYQHIEALRAGYTDRDWQARWQAGGARMTLHVKAAPGTEVIIGVAPGRNPSGRVPLVIARRRAATTVFEVRHEFEQR
jgi:hypothetical protein